MKPIDAGYILSFGELLLRLAPDAGGEWLGNHQLPAFVGGAELNVASALALWQLPSRYITALPANGLSAAIITHVKSRGVDVSSVLYSGHRIGLYYLSQGHDLKHDALIYDRADSAFANLAPGIIDWDAILNGVSWFHFSAICPAISKQVADVCLEALKVASDKGITISVDLNYRAKLWKYGKSPAEVMPELVQYCNVVMGNIWAVEQMLGIQIPASIHQGSVQHDYLQAAEQMSEILKSQNPKCQSAAYTFRFDQEDELTYYGALHTDGRLYHSDTYTTAQITNKVGSGDCFMAGLICGNYKGWAPADIIQYAAAAAYTKLFVNSDVTNKSIQDIQQCINS